MADEAILVQRTGVPITFTCADNAGIPKGSILELDDLMVAKVTTGDTDIIAGIAAQEKIADDGQVTIAVYREGIFKGTAGLAGVTVGFALITDTGTGSANELVVADAGSEAMVGIAMETATDRETFLFELRPMSVNIA